MSDFFHSDMLAAAAALGSIGGREARTLSVHWIVVIGAVWTEGFAALLLFAYLLLDFASLLREGVLHHCRLLQRPVGVLDDLHWTEILDALFTVAFEEGRFFVDQLHFEIFTVRLVVFR